MAAALDGIRVLEFSQLIAGPVTGLNLADLGAEVVKVEPPIGDSGRLLGAFMPHESKLFHALNRGKRSVVIDVQREEGQELMHRLIPGFDAFLINARPGVAARLRVDYETLRRFRPDLVYLENSGFGREGPGSQRSGTDLLAQAYSGLLVGLGKVDDVGAPKPLTTTAPIDYTTGVTGAMAICAALFQRERTGKGQYVATNLLSTAMAFQISFVGELPVVDAQLRDPMLAKVDEVRASGGSYPEILVARDAAADQLGKALFLYYGGYNTADGAIVLGAATPATRQQIRDVVGITGDPTSDPEFNALDPSNDAAVDAVREQIRERMRARTTAEWIADLDAAGAPASPVHLPEEIHHDPQIEAAGLMLDLEHSLTGPERMVGPVAQLEETPAHASTASPALDADTDDVLGEIGLTDDEIAALRESGVVGPA